MTRAVDHALAVLFAVAEDSGGEVTLTGIAKKLGLPKANVLRFLRSLEQRGLVARRDDRSVSLGFAVLTLASAFQRSLPLASSSLPYLRRLRDLTGETASIQIRMGIERACIQQVESPADLKWAVEIGRRFPIASGAAGKVLMAFTGETERAAVLRRVDFQQLAQVGVTDLASFERSLIAVRRDGYALSINGTRAGASAISAAVRDHTGEVVAAIVLAGPSDRMPEARLVELSETVIGTADSMSRALGWGQPEAEIVPHPSAAAGASAQAVPAAAPARPKRAARAGGRKA